MHVTWTTALYVLYLPENSFKVRSQISASTDPTTYAKASFYDFRGSFISSLAGFRKRLQYESQRDCRGWKNSIQDVADVGVSRDRDSCRAFAGNYVQYCTYLTNHMGCQNDQFQSSIQHASVGHLETAKIHNAFYPLPFKTSLVS
jgi:hypothetical protein